jgi:DNA-directed RNA polymerase specialized sigma24 family protein
VTSALRAEVVDRYARGESSAEVADSCGIAKSTVLKILRVQGVEVRPWGKRY